MVEFGPRLPGEAAHHAFCDWLEDEFVDAGLQLLPCDEYAYPDRWAPHRVALEIVGASNPGPVPVASPVVRSASTGPRGITAPLALPGADVAGKIVVVDLPEPAKATAGIFVPMASYLHWPGHTVADWAQMDYTRAWIMQIPGDEIAAGAAAVVFIADNASYEAMKGTFTPHQAAKGEVTKLVVDRDTGAALRTAALAGVHARLTLDATTGPGVYRNVTAVLPGESDETIIVHTHSDGQNAIEENGCLALVQYARHFGSLPPGRRLKRTLVLAAWSAHMTDPAHYTEADGWAASHRDLVERAVGAVAIEHLGCTEWLDDSTKGYVGTGENEIYGIWTTQGPTQALAQKALIKADLYRHLLLKPPVQITVGAAFHTYGVPHVSGIAGPTYLLKVSKSGEIEKMNFELAAKQTSFYADVIHAFDAADRNALRQGDPTLGGTPIPTDVKSKKVTCGPADRVVAPAGHGRRLMLRFYGRRHLNRGVLVTLAAPDAALSDVSIELRRGKTLYARERLAKVDGKVRQVVLRRRGGKKFPAGSYRLVVRGQGKVLLSRTVHVGKAG